MGKEVNGPRKQIMTLTKFVQYNRKRLQQEITKQWASEPLTFDDISKGSFIIITIKRNDWENTYRCRESKICGIGYEDITTLIREENLISKNEVALELYLKKAESLIDMKFKNQTAKSGDHIMIKVKPKAGRKKRIAKFKITKMNPSL